MDTNSGEDWTQRKVREDRSFAPKKDNRGCPLTNVSPGLVPQPFSGHQNYLRKKIKKRIKRPCKVSVLLTMQGLFFVSVDSFFISVWYFDNLVIPQLDLGD